MLLTIAFGLLIIFIAQFFYQQYKRNKQLRGFVSPPGLPFFRHFFMLTSKLGFLPNLLEALNKYGGFLKLELLHGLPFLIVTDKDFILHVLNAKPILTKDDMYVITRNWIGDGLLSSEPVKWKKMRKILSPAFNLQILENYVELFENPCKELIRKLKTETENDGFDVAAYIDLCGLDILCDTVMGVKINAQATNDAEYIQETHTMSKIIVRRLFSALKRIEPAYVFSKDYWRGRTAINRTQKFARKIIDTRRKEIYNKTGVNGVTSPKDVNVNANGTQKRNICLLDILLDEEHNNRITSQDVTDEIQTFLLAGMETSTTCVNFALYSLSKHPEIQNKIIKELKSLFGDDTRPPTLKDLNDMRYLEMVIKETMRLHSPIPFISRRIEEDVSYGDVFIPKGMSVAIFLYGLHRNPDYHPNPEKFNPDRFEFEVAPLTFLPFGSGPRGCLGQRFAMLEVKYVLCQILRKFVILPVYSHTPQPTMQLALKFRNGVMIRLQEC